MFLVKIMKDDEHTLCQTRVKKILMPFIFKLAAKLLPEFDSSHVYSQHQRYSVFPKKCYPSKSSASAELSNLNALTPR